MFYLIFVFLFVAVRYVIHDKNGVRGCYFLLMMTAYIVAVFSLMFFLSKDTYYYNTVYSFFSMPAGIWKWMMLTPVGKGTWINLINLSCLFVLYFAVCFSLSFRPFENQRAEQWIKGLTAGVLVLEFVWYMPEISRRFYLWVYPEKLTYDGYLLVKNAVHLLTCGFNVGLILFNAALLFVACRKASPLRLIRTNILAVSICFVLIMLSYVFLFASYPLCLIKVSRLAGTVTYLSAPLHHGSLETRIFPFYLMVTFVLVVLSMYQMSGTMKKIEQHTFSLTKKIAASDTTSKVFCHYMKNELLAIQSEVEMLAVSAEDQEYQSDAVKRCENLYARLNEIHSSTKASELFLEPAYVLEEVRYVLDHLTYELTGIEVKVEEDPYQLMAMLDVSFFHQAVHNIIVNAADAMREKEGKVLKISVKPLNNWVILFVEDSGKGIEAENLEKIFDPFYSSAPVSQHWGMGLALTHKIITAHEGHIEVASQPGKGTVMKVVLPRLMPEQQKISKEKKRKWQHDKGTDR